MSVKGLCFSLDFYDNSHLNMFFLQKYKPGRLRTTITDSEGIISAEEFAAGQFGNVELLSGALFNKRYTTRLRLNPLSGAIEQLDADQPR